ncbi:hypothetical protein BLS_000405 [Venturia inaequalis]|uniref:Uncharacterized protein n=1 Tax=Venturia inaequalis TaxID=5025 RepID=A0A8H3UZW0_VENIN|nr:hypothetical protein BLS_000405 [Venturia inaequalis]
MSTSTSTLTPKTYIVEHLDTELEEWSSREYASIAKESHASGSKFFLTSVPEELVLPERLQGLEGLTVECRAVEELYRENDGSPSKRVCLLDPQAKQELRPEDGERFDVFLFGGILGDDPPRDRTKELRVKGFEGRRLGPVQMTTDTAVRVTRIIVQDKVKVEDIPYIDHPDLKVDEHESVEMPFRYVRDKEGKPIMPEGMVELILRDSEKGLGDMISEQELNDMIMKTTDRMIKQLSLRSRLAPQEQPRTDWERDAILHADAERPSIALNKAGLQRLLQEFAFGLRNRFGVGANGRNKDVVVLFSTGQVAYPAAFLGIIGSGGVASLASASYTAFELARQIKQGEANILVTSEDLLQTARDAASQVKERKITVLVLRTEPEFSLRIDGQGDEGELRGWSVEDRLPWERITDPKELENGLIALLYSSGTTGEPKGVKLSHQNFVAQQASVSAPVREYVMELAAKGHKFPPSRSLAHLPPAHIAGAGGYLISPVTRGVTVFWMKKYNWPDFLRYNKALKITQVHSVPSIFLRIAKDPAVTDHFKAATSASSGAAPMDGALQKEAAKRVGTGAMMVGQAYGLSESTGPVIAPIMGEMDNTGSIGSVIPNVEVRIVDSKDDDVPSGTPGELICRGAIITKGYFRNPKATEASFRNGWFCTGDVAVERGGKFFIVDRIKELIKYKGLQIAPAELEGILDSHPSVLEAAVIGIPDPSEGASSGGAAHSEIPRAYVVRRQDARVTEVELQDFVKGKLAPYKQLRGGVVFVDSLPKNAVNKLLRRELRDRALQEIRRSESAKL